MVWRVFIIGANVSCQQVKKAKQLRELTWDEKAALVGHIGELPPEQLAHVVQIVAESHRLEGGDAEGEEVELDIGEMSTETLHKLQAFVFQFRTAQGLPVDPLPVEEEVVDDVFLPNEDDEYQPAPTSSGSKSSQGAKSQGAKAPGTKRKAHTSSTAAPRRPNANAAVDAPKNHDELVALADETKRKTDEALQELKNELRRMAGKVVESDHAGGPAGEDGQAVVSAASQYSLNDDTIREQLQAAMAGEDSSSDTVSSDEEEGDGPQIIAPSGGAEQGVPHISFLFCLPSAHTTHDSGD